MILNKIEVKIFDTIELIDAYDKKFPDNFTNKNVIYCVHNKVNGKNYIGQTVKFTDRFSTSYIGHFKDYIKFINGELGDRRILYRAWKKYGLKSFVVYIIGICSDRESLNEKETYWIKTLHTCTKDPECHGYNLSWGADDMGVKDPEAIKRSLATRLEKYGEYFPHCHTKEALAKGNETKIKTIFSDLEFQTKENALEKFHLKELEWKSHKKHNIYLKNKRLFVKRINKILDSDLSLNDWNTYKEFILKSYSSIQKAENHLNNLIDNLSDLKKLDVWTPRLETIFGNLTEKDKLKKKGEI